MYVEVLVGLPGSGKDLYCFNKKRQGYSFHEVINLDDEMKDENGIINYSVDKVVELCFKLKRSKKLRNERIILNGLITSEEIQEAIRMVFVTPSFIYFIPDKEACLYNDRQRGGRPKASNISINYIKLHKPNGAWTRHVIKYNFIHIFLYKYSLINFSELSRGEESFRNMDIVSESWSRGGTWVDYEENEGIIDAEEDKTIEEFDDFIKICNLLLQDKISYKDYSELVYINEYEDSDYYGGSEGRSCLYFKLIILVEKILLNRYGIIDYSLINIRENFPNLYELIDPKNDHKLLGG